MSIKKHYLKNNSVCKVTFTYHEDLEKTESVRILGDFNNWDNNCEPMKKSKTNGFSQTITLKKGYAYQFRYLINNSRWEDEPDSDRFVPNGIDSADFNSLILI